MDSGTINLSAIRCGHVESHFVEFSDYTQFCLDVEEDKINCTWSMWLCGKYEKMKDNETRWAEDNVK